MAKVPANTFFLLRRAYTVVAENVGAKVAAASATRKAAEYVSKGAPVPVDKDVFWMRDPKTGNWIPETHFDEVDVAVQRAKLLPKKA